MSLVPVEPTNALAVSDYLSRAKDWLATAVEMTGPVEIATAHAEQRVAAFRAEAVAAIEAERDASSECLMEFEDGYSEGHANAARILRNLDP